MSSNPLDEAGLASKPVGWPMYRDGYYTRLMPEQMAAGDIQTFRYRHQLPGPYAWDVPVLCRAVEFDGRYFAVKGILPRSQGEESEILVSRAGDIVVWGDHEEGPGRGYVVGPSRSLDEEVLSITEPLADIAYSA